MKFKTEVHAEPGRQDILILREFDLPRSLLFKAYKEPHLVEQWMGTTVLALECQKYGKYRFLTKAPGGIELSLTGVFHTVVPDERIVRTFEMEGMPFGVQLEVLNYSVLSESRSKLTKQVIYQTVEQRDDHLKLPFKQGISMAHDKLQETLSNLI